MKKIALILFLIGFSASSAFYAEDLDVNPDKKAKLEAWRKSVDEQNEAAIRKVLHDKESDRHKAWVEKRRESDEVKQSENLLGEHPNKSRHKDHNKKRSIASNIG